MTADTGTPRLTHEQVDEILARFRLVLAWLERGNPRPLCINGHEYRRRQKSRRRRGRR